MIRSPHRARQLSRAHSPAIPRAWSLKWLPRCVEPLVLAGVAGYHRPRPSVALYATIALMTITVDLDSPVSIEEQVYQALRRVVAARGIAQGENLPTVRQLASDLGVHWTTIARAYRRLAADGLIVVRRGRGATVCTPRPNRRVPATVRATVRQKLIDAVTEARLGGMPLQQVEAALRRELALLEGEPQ